MEGSKGPAPPLPLGQPRGPPRLLLPPASWPSLCGDCMAAQLLSASLLPSRDADSQGSPTNVLGTQPRGVRRATQESCCSRGRRPNQFERLLYPRCESAPANSVLLATLAGAAFDGLKQRKEPSAWKENAVDH